MGFLFVFLDQLLSGREGKGREGEGREGGVGRKGECLARLGGVG